MTGAPNDSKADADVAPPENDDQLRGQLRGLFDAIPDAVWLKDGAGRWLAVNAPALALFHLEGVEYWGKDELDLAQRTPYREALLSCIPSDEQAWNAKAPTHFSETLPAPDGTVRVFDLIKVPLFHSDGARRGLVVIGRDITAQTRAEEERDRLLAAESAARAAAESAERRANLLATASRVLSEARDHEDALRRVVKLVVPFLVDACLVDVDVGASKLRRVAFETVDAAWSDTVLASRRPVDSSAARLDIDLLVGGRSFGRVVFLARSPSQLVDGTKEVCHELAHRIALALDAARLFSELAASHQALAQAHEALVRRERLAALGQLAAIVAHEVRNPLAAIYNCLGSLRKTLHLEGDAAMLFGVVQEEAEQLNRLVGELLDFVRPFHPTLDDHRLGDIIEGAFESAQLAHRSAARVRMTCSVHPALPTVKLDAQLIRVALQNVISNALQAMPNGGELSVDAVAVRRGTSDCAEIAISDTGPGIAAEQIDKVFEPFFTTRASGTGLGLAIVRRILESHRGEVEAKSIPGKGATIVLRLPIDARSSPVAG